MRISMLLSALAALAMTGLSAAPPGNAEPFFGNYQLVIPARYDFHTWVWAVVGCWPLSADCVNVNAIPAPIAKAYEYTGDAHLADGRWTLNVDVPDGLRCGNIYYGPVIATRDVYSWDAGTLQGTMTSSFAVGCDGAPGGTFTYPFSTLR